MRFLLGLSLVPVVAGVMVAICLAVAWVMNPQAFALFWTGPIGIEGMVAGFIIFGVYATPTAVLVLPLVDRRRLLGVRSAALVGAAGGVATVLLSAPLRPEFSGFVLAGRRVILATVLAAIGGAATGMVFAAVRGRFKRA